jgi:tetratricopeptide (TPR) repeat protein
LQESGESGRARDLFEQAIRIAPWMEEAYQGLTGVLVAAGNLAKAEAVLLAGEKAVVEVEKRARLQLSMGFLRAEQGRLAEAIQWFQRSLQTNPSNCEANVALADALAETQRYPQAAEALEAALKQSPMRADVYARLASALEKLGCHAEALAAFQQAISMDPQCLNTQGPDWAESYERALRASEKPR